MARMLVLIDLLEFAVSESIWFWDSACCGTDPGSLLVKGFGATHISLLSHVKWYEHLILGGLWQSSDLWLECLSVTADICWPPCSLYMLLVWWFCASATFRLFPQEDLSHKIKHAYQMTMKLATASMCCRRFLPRGAGLVLIFEIITFSGCCTLY